MLLLIELVIFGKEVLFPCLQAAVKTNTTLRMDVLFSLIQKKQARRHGLIYWWLIKLQPLQTSFVLRHASHRLLQATLFKVKMLFSTLAFCWQRSHAYLILIVL